MVKTNLKISTLALSFCSVCTIGLAEDVELKDLNVSAKLPSKPITSKDKYQGSQSLSKDTINSIAGPKRGLTDFLKLNPNVSFGKRQISSRNQGELDSQDISINGSRTYQNNFSIDGININNDLNPASNQRVSLQAPGSSVVGGLGPLPDIGSISQGINLDPELIQTLNVYDSSVSAKYGGFQGGVVESKTRNPRNGFHGKISTSLTGSKFSRVFIDDYARNDFLNSFTSLNQSKFKKQKFVLELEGYLNEKLGVLFNLSRNYSSIPLLAYHPNFADNFGGQKNKTETRQNDNLFLKARYFANDNLVITPTLIYAPSQAVYYASNAKDSKQTFKSGGIIGSVDFEHEVDWGKIKQTLGFSKLTSSRDAENEYYFEVTEDHAKLKRYGFTDEDLKKAVNSGGYGDIDQIQKNISYKLSFDLDKKKLLDVGKLSLNYTLSSGIDIEKTRASYEVARPFTKYSVLYSSQPEYSNGTGCLEGDNTCIETIRSNRFSGDKKYINYFSRKEVYSGKTIVDLRQYAFWLQNEFELGDLVFRPGVRISSDNITKNANIAPRLALSYSISDSHKISFGVNRYYGRYPIAIDLKRNREKLKTSYGPRFYKGKDSPYANNDKFKEWPLIPFEKSEIYFSNLKIPYDDEISVGLNAAISDLDLNAKYIRRIGKNLIFSSLAKNEGIDCKKLDGNVYKKDSECNTLRVFTNKGKSKSNIYTLTLGNKTPYKIEDSNHKFQLSFNYTDSRSNSIAYNTKIDAVNPHTTDPVRGKRKATYGYVVLDGKVIRLENLPSVDIYSTNNRKWNVSGKWALKLNTISSFPNFLLPKSQFIWSNNFGFNAPLKLLELLEKAKVEYNGETLTSYKTTKISGISFEWDLRFGLILKSDKKSEFFANVDILNVLNKKIVSGTLEGNEYDTSKIKTNVLSYQPGRSFYFEVGYRW